MYSVMRSLTSSRPAWSFVEHLASEHRVEHLVGGLAPRHGDQPVEVRADHRGLAALLAHALEAVELALGLLAHVVGHARLGDLRAVVVGDRAVVLAELLADRLHLLAQEVLALLLLGAVLDVVADAAAHLQLGQALALVLEGELEALGDVERLEDADLLLDRQIGAVAGRVGQRARVDDGAQERSDTIVGAALLEDLLDDRAVLALELARALVDRLGVRVLLDVGAQAGDAGLGRADDGAAVQALERDALRAAGKANRVGDLGDRPDLGVLPVVSWNEQHALLAAHVEREVQVHRWKDDGVVQGDEQELGHAGFLSLRAQRYPTLLTKRQ